MARKNMYLLSLFLGGASVFFFNEKTPPNRNHTYVYNSFIAISETVKYYRRKKCNVRVRVCRFVVVYTRELRRKRVFIFVYFCI